MTFPYGPEAAPLGEGRPTGPRESGDALRSPEAREALARRSEALLRALAELERKYGAEQPSPESKRLLRTCRDVKREFLQLLKARPDAGAVHAAIDAYLRTLGAAGTDAMRLAPTAETAEAVRAAERERARAREHWEDIARYLAKAGSASWRPPKYWAHPWTLEAIRNALMQWKMASAPSTDPASLPEVRNLLRKVLQSTHVPLPDFLAARPADASDGAAVRGDPSADPTGGRGEERRPGFATLPEMTEEEKLIERMSSREKMTLLLSILDERALPERTQLRLRQLELLGILLDARVRVLENPAIRSTTEWLAIKQLPTLWSGVRNNFEEEKRQLQMFLKETFPSLAEKIMNGMTVEAAVRDDPIIAIEAQHHAFDLAEPVEEKKHRTANRISVRGTASIGCVRRGRRRRGARARRRICRRAGTDSAGETERDLPGSMGHHGEPCPPARTCLAGAGHDE